MRLHISIKEAVLSETAKHGREDAEEENVEMRDNGIEETLIRYTVTRGKELKVGGYGGKRSSAVWMPSLAGAFLVQS